MKSISEVADFLDKAIAEMKSAEELKEIQDKFITSKSRFEIVSPNRRRLKDGNAKLKGKPVKLFLFNDVLVFANELRKDQFEYSAHAQLNNAKIFHSEEAEHSTLFKLSYSGGTDKVIQCETIEEKKKWMIEILKVNLELKKKRQVTDVRVKDKTSSTLGVACNVLDTFTDEECVEFIKKNRILMIRYTSGRPQLREFSVSQNEKKIEVYTQKKNSPEDEIRLGEVQELLTGQKTTVFKKSPRPELDGVSFSLFYGAGHRKTTGEWTGKTLDIICEQKEDFLIWTRALSFILQDKGQTTAQRNRVSSKRQSEAPPLKKFKLVGDDCYSWGKGESGALGHGGKDLQKDQKLPKVIRDFLALDVSTFECGESSSFVTLSCGIVFSWGAGKFGQLGHGDSSDIHHPTQVKALGTRYITSVAAGECHTIFLSGMGKVWACGKNEKGQVGIGELKTKKQLSPVKINIPGKVIFIEAGTNHSGVITDNGKVYTWGMGKDGQLGHGNQEDVPAPKLNAVLSEHEVSQLAFGFGHSLALTREGNIWVFGDGQDGQLGNGRCGKGINQLAPTPLQSAFLKNKVKMIASGAFHCGALTKKGKIYMWGNSMYGQVGNGKKENAVKYPTLLTQWIKFPCRTLRCGTFHSLALLDDRGKDGSVKGRVIAWGAGTYGRLGLNTEKDQLAPKEVKFDGREVLQIVAGGCMSAALTKHSWVPEKLIKSCMSCEKKFTYKRRKANCRNCGGVFCKECSRWKSVIIRTGVLEPVKVCEACKKILVAKYK